LNVAGPKRALIGMAAILSAGSWPQPVLAQLAPGLSGSSSQLTMEGGEAMRTLRAFGTCYATRNTANAWILIATEPGSRQEAETYRRLFRRDSQGCLGEFTELQVPVFLVRGAIAEGLYARRVAVPAQLGSPAPAPGTPVRTLSEAARCYVADHPDRVRALVENTAPGSRPEFTALSAMAPDFFRCVPETARGRKFDSTQIRYRLVEALLRRAAPVPAPAGRR
jgi:hypothetical protein